MSRTPLNRRIWPSDIKDKTFTMLKGKNIPFMVANRGYRRWRANEQAERCKYGQDPPPDCSCPGCIEKLLYLLFDQVSTTFVPEPGDNPRPLG